MNSDLQKRHKSVDFADVPDYIEAKKVEYEDTASNYDGDQIRVEELLYYCKEQGVDSMIRKFTVPEYYAENVELSRHKNEKIKNMMLAVDCEMLKEELDAADYSSDDSVDDETEGHNSVPAE